MKDFFQKLFTRGYGNTKDRWVIELKRIGRRKDVWRVGPLLFCHIPKCAGTSVRKIIKAEYKPHQRLFLYPGEPDLFKDQLDLASPNPQFINRFETIRGGVQIIYGHFPFGLHRLLDIPPCYSAVLRHPVPRIVSLYDHLIRSKTEPLPSSLSLKRFVAGRLSPQTNNHMTRILAGVSPNPDTKLCENEVLQLAIENVERYFCAIGTTENLHGILRTLGKRFGWRHHDVPNFNVAPNNPSEIDEETRNVIVEHNSIDIALYEWVVQREKYL